MVNASQEDYIFDDWKKKVDSVELPAWLKGNLSPMPPVRKIYQTDDGFFCIMDGEGNDVSNSFPSFIEAYETVDEGDSFEVVIDDSVSEEYVKEVDGWLIFNEAELGGNVFSTVGNYANSMFLLNSAYYRWVNVIHPRWMDDPNDWVNAYAWLSSHPAFWTRDSSEPTLDWVTDNGLSTAWKGVRTDEDGTPEVLLEHGPHHEPDYTEHALDHNLDSWGETFEECYIKLAKKVHENYGRDGVERCPKWFCTLPDDDDDDEDVCEKHLAIHQELAAHADDPEWGRLVETLWAASDGL